MDAMRIAPQKRPPAPGLICHSDRSAKYASNDGRRLLLANGAKASIGGRGHCLDNAPMESFFGPPKTEMVNRAHFRSRREAKAAHVEYIAIF
ncbi:MAG: IS3 family transposase [Pseudomonadota bacterium]